MTNADVQEDRRAALVALKQRFGGTIVLKGSGTLVSTDGGPPRLCSAGNPGMAAAGMGDVLTGVIAGLRAQGLPAAIAAAAGVQAHAIAGDRAAASGERGMLAGDLMTEIRRCVNP
jgi:NAD(P)H-hydrate epimerase